METVRRAGNTIEHVNAILLRPVKKRKNLPRSKGQIFNTFSDEKLTVIFCAHGSRWIMQDVIVSMGTISRIIKVYKFDRKDIADNKIVKLVII